MSKAHDPLSRVRSVYGNLSPAEKTVADFVQRHPDKTILASLQAISKYCSVSDATVLRFCRALGFSGYQDFKAALVPELLKRGVSIYQEIDDSDNHQTTLDKFIENLNNDIRKTISSYTEDFFNSIAEKIIRAGKIAIVGLAGSAGVGRIFNDTLLGLGIFSYYLSDRVEIERIASRIEKSDVIFGISHSGESEEIVYALKKARDNSGVTIGMTNEVSSSLARYSDMLLLTSVPENILGSYSCQPRITQLALFEFITYEISKIMKSDA